MTTKYPSQEKLLRELIEKSREIMAAGKNFHDFSHVLAVYRNVEELLEHEKGDRLVLLTAALFHDIERDSKNHGIKASMLVVNLLKAIPDFPKEMIAQVSKTIDAHDKNQKTLNEKLLFDADKMEMFNELGIVRSFMMYSREGLSLEEACQKHVDVIDYFFSNLHTDTAKKLARRDYMRTRRFAIRLADRYQNLDKYKIRG